MELQKSIELSPFPVLSYAMGPAIFFGRGRGEGGGGPNICMIGNISTELIQHAHQLTPEPVLPR